jgi:glycosyltransferase involved in cell wall biosynthesis
MQILSTAKYLRQLGTEVDIKLTSEAIDYSRYDLLHIFNAIRPADALGHIKRSGKPYVLSTIFVDFSEYQRLHATGITALLNKTFTTDQMEYIKAVGRWLKNGEAIKSPEYLYWGHRKSVKELAKGAAYLLPNSESEYQRFASHYGISQSYKVVYNGVDMEVFEAGELAGFVKPDAREVLCVSRIEGKKNHLNLIKALNGTDFNLKIIGKPAPNHVKYYEQCRKIAGSNITFENFIPPEQLHDKYKAAKVHVLPSWNETCGLSSLEAAYYYCNLVITDKGDTTEYFGNNAWYCDPGDPASIYGAIVKASEAEPNKLLKEMVQSTYNWQQAASVTLSVYNEVMKNIR